MPRRRAVRHGAEFSARARQRFPPGGSPEGRPSFELFAETVLRAVETALSRDFEGQLAETPGSPIRMVLTAATPFFSEPLVFYALLADEDTVEIIDFVIDEDWLDTPDDDFD